MKDERRAKMEGKTNYTARLAAAQCIVIAPVCGGRAGGVRLLPR